MKAQNPYKQLAESMLVILESMSLHMANVPCFYYGEDEDGQEVEDAEVLGAEGYLEALADRFLKLSQDFSSKLNALDPAHKNKGILNAVLEEARKQYLSPVELQSPALQTLRVIEQRLSQDPKPSLVAVP